MKRFVKRLAFVAAGMLLPTIAAGFVYVLYEDRRAPKPSFSLDNPKAYYSISEDKEGYFWVVYSEKLPPGGVSYIPGGILVGKSKVELEKYVGKRLWIRGTWRPTYAKTQCIVDNCRPHSGVVIDIDSVTLAF